MSQFIEVIEAPDMATDTIVSRFPSEGSAEIKMGAQLIVRESQAAVFFRDGRALDTFGPGRHTLSTLNVPILTKLLSLPTGFTSPFRAEVCFVNLRTFANQKWGTMEPILFRDAELSMVRLRSFGMYSFRVANPQVFVNRLAPTVAHFGTAEVEDFFRSFIVTHVADFLGEHLRSVLDLAQYYNELSAGIRAQLLTDFEKYGVGVSDFKILSISPPDHVQEMIDKRGGIAAVGDMQTFVQYQAGQALGNAGDCDGSGAGNLVGAGVGLGAGLGVVGGLAGAVAGAFGRGGPGAGPGGGSGGPVTGGRPPCTNCQAALPPDARFCAACGQAAPAPAQCTSCQATLAAGAAFCSQCGAQQGSTACPSCQAQSPAGSRFCAACGHALEGD